MRNIILFLILIGFVGYASNKSYANEENNTTILSENYNKNDIWKNRREDSRLGDYIAFTSFVGKGEDRQTELFLGKYKEGKLVEIIQLTKTKEYEYGSVLSDEMRIYFGRSKSYDINSEEKYYSIDIDGNNERPESFTVWQRELARRKR